jgi:RHS repeat-associated protein
MCQNKPLSLLHVTPFGSGISTRAIGNYRYGFNTQEKDDEVAGEGNSYTAEFWQFDSRLGRRFNVDPVDQVSVSNYAVLKNNPLLMIDIKGDKSNSRHLDSDGNVIAEYDDGDDNVYKHQTAKTKADVDYWRNKFKNKSGNGVNIGRMTMVATSGIYSKADFGKYFNGSNNTSTSKPKNPWLIAVKETIEISDKAKNVVDLTGVKYKGKEAIGWILFGAFTLLDGATTDFENPKEVEDFSENLVYNSLSQIHPGLTFLPIIVEDGKDPNGLTNISNGRLYNAYMSNYNQNYNHIKNNFPIKPKSIYTQYELIHSNLRRDTVNNPETYLDTIWGFEVTKLRYPSNCNSSCRYYPIR